MAQTGARAAQPSFSESDGSGIQKMDIVSNEDKTRKVSLVNGTMRFLYYESILQDSIRATLSYSDAGNTIEKDGAQLSAMEGLPIVGQENLQIKIQDNGGNALEMVLYVNEVTPLTEDTRKSVVQLNLASREYIWNEKVRVNKRFDGKISESIKSLLEDEMYLGPTQEAKDAEGYKAKTLDIEPTSNTQNYIGNNKKPYYIINWLSRGAVPDIPGAKKNTAGFFFYETSKGLHFKSIDGLMDTDTNKPKKSYIYNESPDGSSGEIPAGYDAKALTYGVNNAVNVQNKLKMGAYSTRLITFNPFDCYYEVTTPNAGTGKATGATAGGGENQPGDQKNLKLAGKKLPPLNPEFEITKKGREFSRTTYMVLDTGSLPEGKGLGEGQEQLGEKSQQENYKPGEVLNQGIMRMNQLFALKTTITIPGDFSLHAGDAIYVDAPQLKTTKEGKGDSVDQQTGGNYIISDLCHFMSPENTLTKLTLVRDSFGRKAKERG